MYSTSETRRTLSLSQWNTGREISEKKAVQRSINFLCPFGSKTHKGVSPRTGRVVIFTKGNLKDKKVS